MSEIHSDSCTDVTFLTSVQLKYAAVANTASGPHRGKRQTGSEFRPIRMMPFFDTTVEA